MQAQTQQVKLADAIVAEIEQEAEATKRLLDIVPEDKLSWRPHHKAMSLGELALHIALIQGGVATMVDQEFGNVPDFAFREAESRDEIVQAFIESTKTAKEIVSATSDEKAAGIWQLRAGEEVVLTMPRAAFWRVGMLNHYYHHRGQLSTYLRQLDLPLPSVYGPTADTTEAM